MFDVIIFNLILRNVNLIFCIATVFFIFAKCIEFFRNIYIISNKTFARINHHYLTSVSKIVTKPQVKFAQQATLQSAEINCSIFSAENFEQEKVSQMLDYRINFASQQTSASQPKTSQHQVLLHFYYGHEYCRMVEVYNAPNRGFYYLRSKDCHSEASNRIT